MAKSNKNTKPKDTPPADPKVDLAAANAARGKDDHVAPDLAVKPPKMALRITAKVDGFRRCGVAHSEAPTEYPSGHFTKAEIAILEAEPNLVVQRL